MTIYTLYVKTHRKTGLKYLGQTSRNPFKYAGSGIDWKLHLKQFGYCVDTEILLQTTDKSERNSLGRHLSALWHIVTAADDYGNKLWANRIPETGGGSGHRHDDDTYKNMAENRKGKKNKNISIAVSKSWQNPDRKEKHRTATAGDKHFTKRKGYVSPRLGVKAPGTGLAGDRNPAKRPDVRDKMRGPRGPNLAITGEKHYTARPGYVNPRKGRSIPKEADGYVVKPTNKNYDHAVYEWTNDVTGEVVHMNRREFMRYSGAKPAGVANVINGHSKHTKGWRLLGLSKSISQV